MDNKKIGKNVAKGVLGAATAVGVASAAGLDMKGVIRRISIVIIVLGLFLGVLGHFILKDEWPYVFRTLTGLGVFLAFVWYLIANFSVWFFGWLFGGLKITEESTTDELEKRVEELELKKKIKDLEKELDTNKD
tara:strand:+ start:5600 stop:6001 length:402 start_codon:yes stop_codon:yes gene_type:complete